jgi:hypothetical protein
MNVVTFSALRTGNLINRLPPVDEAEDIASKSQTFFISKDHKH